MADDFNPEQALSSGVEKAVITGLLGNQSFVASEMETLGKMYKALADPSKLGKPEEALAFAMGVDKSLMGALPMPDGASPVLRRQYFQGVSGRGTNKLLEYILRAGEKGIVDLRQIHNSMDRDRTGALERAIRDVGLDVGAGLVGKLSDEQKKKYNAVNLGSAGMQAALGIYQERTGRTIRA